MPFLANYHHIQHGHLKQICLRQYNSSMLQHTHTQSFRSNFMGDLALPKKPLSRGNYPNPLRHYWYGRGSGEGYYPVFALLCVCAYQCDIILVETHFGRIIIHPASAPSSIENIENIFFQECFVKNIAKSAL